MCPVPATAPTRIIHIAVVSLLAGLVVAVAAGPVTAQQPAPDDHVLAVGGAGEDFACAIRTGGRLVCWGDNTHGQASPPLGPPVPEVVHVTAGGRHGCALTADRHAICWGDNTHGQASPPPGPFQLLDAGRFHTCGQLLHSGDILCWGDDSFGQSSVPREEISAMDLVARSLRAGPLATCALQQAESLAAVCWGTFTTGFDTQPATLEPGPFTRIAVTERWGCGVRAEDGIPTCWGAKSGPGSDWDAALPIPTEALVEISGGTQHVCGLRPDDTAVCWGMNDAGQADPPVADHRGPSPRYTAISAGGASTCAMLEDASVQCWGRLGHVPLPSSPSRGLAAGAAHTCYLLPDERPLVDDNAVLCWGEDSHGQSSPPAGLRLRSLDAGRTHTCGLLADRTIACWGDDRVGQSSPPSGRFEHVAAGNRTTCAVRDDLAVVCWGASQIEPPPAGPHRSVAVGSMVACAISLDNMLACWTVQPPIDLPIMPEVHPDTPPAGTFTAVSVGIEHACAIGTDGTITCWGPDDARVAAPAGTYTAIAAGDRHSCAIASDGAVACWGDVPTDVLDAVPGTLDGERARQVTAGSRHSCAERLDSHEPGSVVRVPCLGDNDADQLGRPVALTLPDAVVGIAYDEPAFRPFELPLLDLARDVTPPGLVVTETGHVVGTPTEAGTFPTEIVVLTLTGSGTNVGFMQVTAQGGAPVFTSGPPPEVIAGEYYEHMFTAEGDPEPTFSITDGHLPDGLALAPDGTLSGVTFDLEPSFTFTVTADNGRAPAASQTVTLHVTGTPIDPPGEVLESPRFTSPEPQPARAGRFYQHQFTASGNPPPSFVLLDGPEPPGLQLSPDGLLAGIPSEAGQFVFTVMAHNGEDPADIRQVHLTVLRAACVLVTEDITLDGDLDCPDDSDGIVVLADGVTIDMAGATLRGNGTGTGVLLEGRLSVSVRNGTLTGWDVGVTIDGHTTLARLDQVGVTESASHGLVVSGLETRLHAVDSAANGGHGLWITPAARGTTLSRVSSTDNAGHGILDEGSDSRVLGRLTVSGNQTEPQCVGSVCPSSGSPGGRPGGPPQRPR